MCIVVLVSEHVYPDEEENVTLVGRAPLATRRQFSKSTALVLCK